jgi:serine/threonine protein kinase
VAATHCPLLPYWDIILTVLHQRLGGLTREISQTCANIYSDIQAARLVMDGGYNSDEDQRYNLFKSLYDKAEFDHPLGSGDYYLVSAMVVRRTGETFARKYLRASVKEHPDIIRDKVVEGLRSEGAILKLIQSQPHLHLPTLRGSNLDGEDIYIDTFPVGNSDLRKFFDDFYISEQRLDLKKQIIRGFSCLASQLEHLHKRLKIFHNDIRPRNIINVHGRMVLIDYSISVVLSKATELHDRALFLSRETSAPECK